MKREYVIFGIVMLIVIISLSIVTAEDTNVPAAKDAASVPQADVGKAVVASSNKVLESNVVIPPALESVARFALGITPDSPVGVDDLIILMCMWVILLFLVKSILEFVPLFGEGWKSWVGAVIVTLLSSMTGWMKSLAVIWFSFGSFFKGQDLLNIILNVIILILLAVGAIALIRMIKKQAGEEEAEILGLKVGTGS